MTSTTCVCEDHVNTIMRVERVTIIRCNRCGKACGMKPVKDAPAPFTVRAEPELAEDDIDIQAMGLSFFLVCVPVFALVAFGIYWLVYKSPGGFLMPFGIGP